MSNWDIRDIGTFMVFLLVLPLFLLIYIPSWLFVQLVLALVGLIHRLTTKREESDEYTAWVDPRPDDLLNGDYE